MAQNPYPHPILAREGWPFIALTGVVALVTTAWWEAGSLPFWALFLFVVQFFRDPARPIPDTPNAVLSPADGRIVAIEATTDPWRKCPALKVSVFMNVFNVHSNRSPVDGTVLNRWYHPGKFLNAALDKASVENERNALHFKTDDGHELTCVQVAGLIARRILCTVEPGQHLARGERYGFIRFGSRVDLYLPPESQVCVTIGEKVKATSTILALLPEAPEKP
ncbi:phosphatidylserine decarboxylase [Hydrogenophilus hirschii]